MNRRGACMMYVYSTGRCKINQLFLPRLFLHFSFLHLPGNSSCPFCFARIAMRSPHVSYPFISRGPVCPRVPKRPPSFVVLFAQPHPPLRLSLCGLDLVFAAKLWGETRRQPRFSFTRSYFFLANAHRSAFFFISLSTAGTRTGEQINVSVFELI